MGFTKQTETASKLIKDVDFSSLHKNIQNNVEIEFSQNSFSPGSRLLPVGKQSPFMVVGTSPTSFDINSFYEDDDHQKILNLLSKNVGISKKDMYLTHAIKYPVGDEKPMFVDGKRHLREFFYDELHIVQPDIIFLLDSWTVKLFEKAFRIELKEYDDKYILPIRLQSHQLEYETYIIPLSYLKNEESKDQVKSLVNKIKIDWKFVHLHCHNSYSLKDGIGTPATRIDWHVKRRKPAIATTNHGNIHDWITIYEGAKNNGMKPLLGMEAYFNRRADELEKYINVDSKEAVAKRKYLRKYNSHITMFCRNETGFHNFIKIHNDGWVNRFYHSPIISPKMVSENSEGLLVLSGCSSAEQNQLILQKHRLMSEDREKERKTEARDKVLLMKQLFKSKRDDKFLDEELLDEWDFDYFYTHQNEGLDEKSYYAEALEHIEEVDKKFIEEADKRIEEVIDWWHNLLGENYFLEIMVLDYEQQKIVNQELIKISRRKSIPLVLTNDVHYISRNDSEIQRLMMLSDQDKTFFDLETQEKMGGGRIWTIKSREMYYKSIDELYDAWKKWHESDVFTEEVFWQAVDGAIKVQDQIEDFEIDRSPKLPRLYGNSKQILVKKLSEGMKKYGFIGNKEYEDRLKFEMKVIADKGFIDYFLIMEDIISWAKNNFGENCVGAGRGSAAGSLVNYVLGITGVDPLKHDLLFERFLDIKREDSVDIDTDFEPRIRDKVLQYMEKKYGSENVIPIGTFGLLKTRSAILDTARVLGIPPQETMAVTTKLPTDLDEDTSLEELEDKYSNLKSYLDKHTNEQHPMRVYIDAIRGSQRNASMHACGVLLTSNSLMDNVALMKTKRGVVTGWVEGASGRELSEFGYYKYDILGLMNLQVINDAVDLIKERRGEDIDITQIEINDPSVYTDVVQNRDHYGVFQFESPLAYRLLDIIKPDNFDELSDISALMRPGPLKMKMPEEYARRKHGKADENGNVWSVEDIPECIREILSPTYGILVYQEQLMQIAEAIGGMDKGDTNKLRKLIIKYGQVSQNDPAYIKNMKVLHDQFIKHAAKKENLGTIVAAEEMWELMAAFAGYAFNRSHSISYTLTSIREYWLKKYYDSEFNISLLNNSDKGSKKGGESLISRYMTEMRRKGYDIIAPSINTSLRDFSLKSDREIIWGFSSIKNLPDASIDIIVDERKNGEYVSIDDFYNRCKKLGKRAYDSLVWSGALDEFMNDELSSREKIHEYIFSVLRKDKKYEIEHLDEKGIINKEIEYCNFSLSEANYFIEMRKHVGETLGEEINALYEAEDIGRYYVVAKIEGIENKKTKGKNVPYKRISLKDETKMIKHVYAWPWKCKQTEDLAVDKVVAARIEHDDSGFINLRNFDYIT